MSDTILSPTSTVARPAKTQVHTVQHYLEREFPGQVVRTWWDRTQRAQVFEFAHAHGRRHIVIEPVFFQACSDYVSRLRDSELADYVRESLAPARCFLVKWYQDGVHIRSKPL